jgi:hypothetical protein
VGESIGRKLGGALGNFAGRKFRSLFGSGDYHEEHEKSGLDLEANSIVQPMTAAQVPLMGAAPSTYHGAVMVQHREYILDVQIGAVNAFSNYRLNPANDLLFPWLHTLAENFEQWIPVGLVFEFVSTCGNAVSSTQTNLGDVNMATQYDTTIQPFTTKSQLLNNFYATSAASSQNLMHAIECSPTDTPFHPMFIHSDANPAVPTDPRLQDLGIFTVLTGGAQSGTAFTCGQLWISYEIILLKPKIYRPAIPDAQLVTALALAQRSERTGKATVSENELHSVLIELEREDEEKFHVTPERVSVAPSQANGFFR